MNLGFLCVYSLSWCASECVARSRVLSCACRVCVRRDRAPSRQLCSVLTAALCVCFFAGVLWPDSRRDLWRGHRQLPAVRARNARQAPQDQPRTLSFRAPRFDAHARILVLCFALLSRLAGLVSADGVVCDDLCRRRTALRCSRAPAAPLRCTPLRTPRRPAPSRPPLPPRRYCSARVVVRSCAPPAYSRLALC